MENKINKFKGNCKMYIDKLCIWVYNGDTL